MKIALLCDYYAAIKIWYGVVWNHENEQVIEYVNS